MKDPGNEVAKTLVSDCHRRLIVIEFVSYNCHRRLIVIEDCHRRINYANDKLLLCLSKLKELIPTSVLDTLTTIADKRANKTTEQHHAIVQ